MSFARTTFASVATDSIAEFPPKAMLGVNFQMRVSFPSSRILMRGVLALCAASPTSTVRPECQCSKIPSSMFINSPRSLFSQRSPKSNSSFIGKAARLAASISMSLCVYFGNDGQW